MSNPYVDIAYEVFDEMLDELTDSKEWSERNNDPEGVRLCNEQIHLVLVMKGNFRVKLDEEI